MTNNLKKMLYLGINRFKQKNLKNEYIRWLSYANAGMLHWGNLYCIDLAIKNLPSNNPVLEIGSFCGLSTNIISFLLCKYEKTNKLISADKWIFGGVIDDKNVGESHISFKEYSKFVKSSFKRNTEFFSSKNKPFTIEAFSDEFFELWDGNKKAIDVFNREIQLGGKISFCYIDGNHKYSFTKRDFVNVDKYLDIGGYILFDDSNDFGGFGAGKFMKEMKKNIRYKLVIKNPNYLFQKLA
jgi:hypothetical protein